MSPFDNAISWLRPLRWIIIVIWIAIDLCGLIYGLKFFDETTTTFVAPKESDAYIATQSMNEVCEIYLSGIDYIVFSIVIFINISVFSCSRGHSLGVYLY